MKFSETELTIPTHWLSAIINGDETSFDYYDDPADYDAYQRFTAEEIGSATVCLPDEWEPEFLRYHDAQPYGVLACDCVRAVLLRPVE